MAEKTTIARPYAQAVFAIAQEQGDLTGWSEMLSFCSVVAGDPDMANILDNPRLTREQLVNLFIDICGDGLTDTGKSVLRVLAENDRLEFLPEIAVLYEQERAAAEGMVQAEVVSATELTEAQKDAIAGALKKRLGRDVSLDCKVDETLLGGAVIRAGDVVIDGSVVSKLDRLSNSLLH